MNELPDYPVLHLDKCPTSKDSTQYLKAEPDGRIERLLRGLGPEQEKRCEYSVDCSAVLECDGWADAGRARVVACRCFRNKQWSVTLRCTKNPPSGESTPGNPPQESNFRLSPKFHPDYFTNLQVTCDVLGRQIFASGERRTGLVVITGATASGKSEVTRGLIEHRMRHAVELHRDNPSTFRKPHLITVEDPIEKFYVEDNEQTQPHEFDYTPREKGIDAPDVKSVLMDALRQTPTLVFVGEIRDPREWIDVLNFASTGHSIIATAHAGSLGEAWGKVLRPVTDIPSLERSDVANRVLGIVHLRSFSEGGMQGALPALWRYTLPGAMALVANGRSSLLPLRGAPSESSFGRTWFKSAIVAQMKEELEREEKQERIDALTSKIMALERNLDLDVAVLRSDLEGL
jgi:hypothetical protein